ncbi:MAG: hypothetical protein RI637_06850 [Acidimicrobiia bacterium]|nr:hypothetical protein [Acidimicrobiia bacterium]
MSIRESLSGGNPRKLQNVDVVVALVLEEPGRLDELIGCILDHDDEIVRMRAGDALEKVCRERPSLLQPHVPLLLGRMSQIDQPSVQWHVAQMLGHVRLTARQRTRAALVLRNNLDYSSDWIVLNWSLETLAALARRDLDLIEPLRRSLRHHEHSSYKSLAKRARVLLAEFGAEDGPGGGGDLRTG